jgi:hypothetical protein
MWLADILIWIKRLCFTVISYIYVFGSSLLGEALLKLFIEDATFPSKDSTAVCSPKLCNYATDFVPFSVTSILFYLFRALACSNGACSWVLPLPRIL